MKNKKWIFLLAVTLTFNAFAEGTYFLPGPPEGYETDLSAPLTSEDKGKDYFIPDALKEEMLELDANTILWSIPNVDPNKMSDHLNKKKGKGEKHFIMEANKDPDYKQVNKEKESSTHFDQIPQGTNLGENDKYLESDILARMKESKNKGQTSFTFTFFYDGNKYEDKNNVYDKTFGGDDAEWYNNAWAILSSEWYLLKSWFNFGIGGNIGFSYKAGNGVFAENGKKSDTKFTLVSIPLDFSVSIEFNFWDWVRLEGLAGPSVMFIVQNRDDRESDENDKTVSQLSAGFFVGTRFKLSLGEIFPETNKQMFETNDVTNYFISFDIRYQWYSNFKEDDIKVSGASAGLGLSFEFL